ncbi:MAG TPA: xylose isomerase [Elusimicrobia bacterium]|nr:xylose isomerase [Elusimicrobiota bacterium]
MFTLTGMGDEISFKLEKQMEVLASEEIKYLELRGIEGRNVLDFTNDELKNIKKILDNYAFKISAIASPIGKISLSEEFDYHLIRFRRAIEIAHFFQVPYIRIFSYYIPKDLDLSQYRDEVLRRMGRKVEIAKEENIILLSENEHGIYGENPKNCLDILQSINSPNLRCLFDPGNFIIEGIKPFDEAYLLLKDYIEYVHMKDAVYAPGEIKATLPGEGEGQIKEILTALKSKGFKGFVSIEPHLSISSQFAGISGDVLFRNAIQSLKKIIAEIGS